MLFIVPIVLRVIAANIITATLIKKASGEGRIRRFVLQFAVAGIIAGFVGWPLHFDTTFWIIAVIGFVNALAAYCQWRSMDISMSKSSLYTWADDIIAMTLAASILSEGSVLNRLIGGGIALSLLAVGLFIHKDVSTKSDGLASPLMLWVWVAGYSVVWGIAMFLMRYFAVGGVPLVAFLVPWYWGSFLGAVFVYLMSLVVPISVEKNQDRPSSLMHDAVLSLGLGVGIMTSLALGYWALQLAPLIIVQPTFLIAEMVFPVAIGLIGFGEGKKHGRYEWLCYGLGAAGVILIAFGFSVR